MKKLKFGQNTKGNYMNYNFNSTMKKLTVYNAPVWVRDSHGYWREKGYKTVTVGVANEKDFNFEALFKIATNPPTEDIAVA